MLVTRAYIVNVRQWGVKFETHTHSIDTGTQRSTVWRCIAAAASGTSNDSENVDNRRSAKRFNNLRIESFGPNDGVNDLVLMMYGQMKHSMSLHGVIVMPAAMMS